MSSSRLIDPAMQTLRHAFYGPFLAHHVMVCHGCDLEAACRIGSARRTVQR